MTVADVLDGSIALIKAAPRLVFTITAAFVVPLELVAAWVQRDSLAEAGLFDTISTAASSSSADLDIGVPSVVLIVASGMLLALVTGAIAHLLTSWYADRTASARDAISASLRRSPALLGAWIAVHVVEAVAALFLVVPALFVMPLFLVVSPAIAVEGLSARRGIQRSWQLTRVRYGSALGIALLVALVSSLLGLALSGLGLAFSFLSFAWVIEAVCRSASALVTVPFVAGAATLTYLDLRIRTEGLDLELDIAEHFTHGT